MTVAEIKRVMRGEWVSIAPEVRPSTIKNLDVSITPFYLTRAFTYRPNDEFQPTILNLADAYGKALLSKRFIKGHMIWQGDHPILAGAQKVTFVAEEYTVTPLMQAFADAMNRAASTGFAKWEVDREQSVFKKAFPPFALAAEQVFAEYDLIYLSVDMLFWGARHVDGSGFDRRQPTHQFADTARQKAVMNFNPRFKYPPGIARTLRFDLVESGEHYAAIDSVTIVLQH
jgi:hypothetical protein